MASADFGSAVSAATTCRTAWPIAASEENRCLGSVAWISTLSEAGATAGIAARLEELRRSATADRIEADLATATASDTAGLTAELRALVTEDPLAERPRALLMRGRRRRAPLPDAGHDPGLLP